MKRLVNTVVGVLIGGCMSAEGVGMVIYANIQ